MIAGLDKPDSGRLMLDGKSLTRIPARGRGFGIVFQAYSLFPNMTVAGNIAYPMKIRGAPAAEIAARVTELLGLIRLDQLADRYPYQLSGGQQQRVALARAVAAKPRLLLLATVAVTGRSPAGRFAFDGGFGPFLRGIEHAWAISTSSSGRLH